MTPELHKRVEQDVITICKALGYDLNTVEFAIKDGVPYAIDCLNPAPDAELASVGEYNHNWIVENMTEFILKKLKEGWDAPEYRWSVILNPASQPKNKVAARAAKAPANNKARPTTTSKASAEKNTRAKKAGN